MKQEEIADAIATLKKYEEIGEKATLFSPERAICEIVKKLKEEGVPDEINAPMAAIALGRIRERRAYAKLIREAFPIQQLPTGASPIYYQEPPADDEEK
jgi:enhancing lycopene biosynthesis protein 2